MKSEYEKYVRGKMTSSLHCIQIWLYVHFILILFYNFVSCKM